MSRWTKKRPNAAQKRAAAREQELAQCQQGCHNFTATFRPSEEVCLTCGVVTYCPQCLKESKLPEPYNHALPLACVMHKKVEVRA